MDRKFLTRILIVIVLIIAGVFIWQKISMNNSITPKGEKYIDISQNQHGDTDFKINPPTPIAKINPGTDKKSAVIAKQNDSIPANWKTYTNEKYGFRFQYPPTLSQQGKEYETTDLSGKVTLMGVNFTTAVSGTTLLIEYHVAPNGAKLYEYALSEYNSSRGLYEKGSKELEIDGNRAIEAISKILVDGKGNEIKPPLRLIIVDVLDKQKAGEIQMQFKTPLSNDTETIKFQKILSTLKFN